MALFSLFTQSFFVQQKTKIMMSDVFFLELKISQAVVRAYVYVYKLVNTDVIQNHPHAFKNFGSKHSIKFMHILSCKIIFCVLFLLVASFVWYEDFFHENYSSVFRSRNLSHFFTSWWEF
jgi:hypothetical protein